MLLCNSIFQTFIKLRLYQNNTQLSLKYYIARNFHGHSDGKELVTCLMTIVISEKMKIIKPVLSTHDTFYNTSKEKQSKFLVS